MTFRPVNRPVIHHGPRNPGDPPALFEGDLSDDPNAVEVPADAVVKFPATVTCTGCRKPLDANAHASSPAGAPWCGDCPIWWFR